MTEFDEYKTIDWKQIRHFMSDQALFYDLRSYLDIETISQANFDKVFRLGSGYL